MNDCWWVCRVTFIIHLRDIMKKTWPPLTTLINSSICHRDNHALVKCFLNSPKIIYNCNQQGNFGRRRVAPVEDAILCNHMPVTWSWTATPVRPIILLYAESQIALYIFWDFNLFIIVDAMRNCIFLLVFMIMANIFQHIHEHKCTPTFLKIKFIKTIDNLMQINQET